MKIFVCVNPKKENSRKAFASVVMKLKEFGAEILLDSANREAAEKDGIVGAAYGSAERNAAECDVFVTIGGDGTILRWGKRAAAAKKPLLGVNTGRLGFMATLETDRLDKLEGLFNGKYSISRRMMIDVTLERKTETKKLVALNDVVMFKSSASKLPEYVVSCDNAEVSRVRADGVIISTPTGSTAYSLSAGGPIIDPQLCCFELTSLCSHTLFNRPMIFSAESVLTAHYVGYENSSVFVTVDGADSIDLHEDERIIIEKSDLELELIDLSENSFYNSIHNKLMRPLK